MEWLLNLSSLATRKVEGLAKGSTSPSFATFQATNPTPMACTSINLNLEDFTSHIGKPTKHLDFEYFSTFVMVW